MSYFNTRVESVLQVTDEKNGPTIVDPEKLFMIKQLLCSVLRVEVVKSRDIIALPYHRASQAKRRLDQLVFADKDS